MLVGSCLSLIGVGAIIVDVVRYKRLRTLVGRPIAPLLYRSACDGVFASMFLVAHIFQGKGIVLGFSVYCSVFGALYSIVLFADNRGSKTTGLWIWVWLGFSLLLCSRGLVDFFIWKLYHLRNITIVID